jgi:sulfur carrier protein
MKIILNGKEFELERPVSVRGLILLRGIKSPSVVVERNRTIVSMEEWDSVMITEGDTIEVLSLVGGG